MKEFVKKYFNKSAFKDVTFSKFEKTYTGKLRGHNLEEVAKELGIKVPKKKEEK